MNQCAISFADSLPDGVGGNSPVNHSRFAVFPPRTFDEDPAHSRHIPIAALGLVAYALIAGLALAGWWWLTFQAALVSFMFAGFLSYLEAWVLEKWCIYCLWSQGIITVILLASGAALMTKWMRLRRPKTAER